MLSIDLDYRPRLSSCSLATLSKGSVARHRVNKGLPEKNEINALRGSMRDCH